jgi:hypothetical protein
MKNAMNSIAGIQIDLKYHMYNKRYLNSLLDWLPTQGINTILLEYEDKFPYRKYPFLRAEDAFTHDELVAFLNKARTNRLRVIPLVQSLSHLEFALDHPELAHLSEAPDIPTQICPSNPESVEFVFDLMKEVLEYHREDEFFHCGADETWFLGTCAKCAEWKSQKGMIKMFAEHEKRILDFIVDQGKRPIIWDDIFWSDFKSIGNVDIPKQTILMCWNYNITSRRGKSGDSVDGEFGGEVKYLQQVDAYRKAGYDCIGCPCCNYGQILPRHSGSISNTRVWAQKTIDSEMLGVINSSWSVFHTPLQFQLQYFSATAELMRDPERKIDECWLGGWVDKEFGISVEGLDYAFETAGTLWEIPMPEYGRPFSPLIYSYMNMVLHYPGRQQERKKRGAYPNDWDSIDFSAIYRKGIEEVKKGNLQEICVRLDKLLEDYPEAIFVFRKLADQAVKNKDIAEMYLFFSELKYLSAKIFSFLLRNDSEKDELLSELISKRGTLITLLEKCYEKEGAARMFRVWWQPLYDSLQ